MISKNPKYQKILKQVDQYYTDKLVIHGPTHLGVDWKSVESQKLRFDQLLRIIKDDRDASVIDYGCGYGALASYMHQLSYTGPYLGFDISEAMIKEAKRLNKKQPKRTFMSDITKLKVADYTIASGIFNVKKDVPDKQWLSYILDTLEIMSKHSRKGFAFNMLTGYSDKNKMRSDLFYADLPFFIDYCVRTYGRHIAMFQDYGLFEFTILVRFL